MNTLLLINNNFCIIRISNQNNIITINTLRSYTAGVYIQKSYFIIKNKHIPLYLFLIVIHVCKSIEQTESDQRKQGMNGQK